mgnify:CR=1 FL=1
MTELKDRIRLIRKQAAKLTQEKFADVLGTTRPAIASYELGKVVPSDTLIQLICSKFSVNENWLRAGKGEMCQKTTSERLDEIAKELQLTPNQTKVFHILMGLPSEKREVIANAFFLICDENDRRRNEEQSAAIQSEQAIIQKEEETTPDEEDVSV